MKCSILGVVTRKIEAVKERKEEELRLKEIYCQEKIGDFVSKTLPAMLENRCDLNSGWDGSFTKQEYVDFLDNLYDRGIFYVEDLIHRKIVRFLRGFPSDVLVDKGVRGNDNLIMLIFNNLGKANLGKVNDAESVAWEIYRKLKLEDVIGLFLPRIKRDLESGNIDVMKFYKKYVFDRKDFEVWKKKRKESDKNEVIQK